MRPLVTGPVRAAAGCRARRARRPRGSRSRSRGGRPRGRSRRRARRRSGRAPPRSRPPGRTRRSRRGARAGDARSILKKPTPSPTRSKPASRPRRIARTLPVPHAEHHLLVARIGAGVEREAALERQHVGEDRRVVEHVGVHHDGVLVERARGAASARAGCRAGTRGCATRREVREALGLEARHDHAVRTARRARGSRGGGRAASARRPRAGPWGGRCPRRRPTPAASRTAFTRSPVPGRRRSGRAPPSEICPMFATRKAVLRRSPWPA